MTTTTSPVRTANFPEQEEGRVMPARQPNAEFRVTTEPFRHARLAPTHSAAVQRASQATNADPIEVQNHSNQSAARKATRNRAPSSNQGRRKASRGYPSFVRLCGVASPY